MNTTTLTPAVDNDADVDSASGDAERFLCLAAQYRSRAGRMRERATALGPGLSPLRTALCRRASELELASAALGAVAEGERCARATGSDVPPPPEPPRPDPTKPPLPEVPPPPS